MSLKTVIKGKNPESEVTNEELLKEGSKPQDANIYNGSKED